MFACVFIEEGLQHFFMEASGIGKLPASGSCDSVSSADSKAAVSLASSGKLSALKASATPKSREPFVSAERSVRFGAPPPTAAAQPRYQGTLLVPDPLWDERQWLLRHFAFARVARVPWGDDGERCVREYTCKKCGVHVDDKFGSAAMARHMQATHGIDLVEPPKRAWSTPLGACCDDWRVALDVLLCYPCAVARLRHVTSEAPSGLIHSYDPNVPAGCFPDGCARHTGCCGASLLAGALTLCVFGPCWGYGAGPFGAARWDVRDVARIGPGGACGVCCLTEEQCVALYCTPCSVCQMHRELSALGVWPGLTCFARPQCHSQSAPMR